MLDIIIPTYKNKEGLRKTLISLNPSILSSIKVTIIDDCSDIYYNDILEEFPFVQIYYNKENSGPGYAREQGIQITNEPYIMFIDTGDYFISYEAQHKIIMTLRENPNNIMYFWQYKINEKISNDNSNRLHGRIYSRDFLKKYDIHFCITSSFTNEDIGFNRTCRLIAQDKELNIFHSKEPVIVYEINENSLTGKDNRAFFFKQQNEGLALNSIEEIKCAEKNNVSKILILEEINTIMASLYYTFLCTYYERPEYINEAWKGAKIFYDKCFSNYPDNEPSLITSAYSVYVKRIYSRAKGWKNFKSVNFTKFLKDLKNYDTPPSWYNN